MKIAVIIATCNRKEMLSGLLEDCVSQTRKPDGILVIDNGSDDGTAEHVREHFPSVQLIELKQNNGYFESLEISVKIAIKEGYDAVWSVDDDARLKENSLECLLSTIELHSDIRESVIWCANLTPDGHFFTEPVHVKIEGEWRYYNEYLPELHDKVYETTGGPNIGVYMPLSVIKKVGPPRAEMVFNGWVEFLHRLDIGGVRLFRCFSSILYHKRHDFKKVKIMGVTRHVSKVSPWHTYYEIRNRIYTDILHKRTSVFKSLAHTAITAFIKLYTCDRKISTLLHILRGVYDGLFGRMGMKVRIPRVTHDTKPE